MTTELIVCPICGNVIFRADASPIHGRASIPTRTPLERHAGELLTEMVKETQRMIDEKRIAAEVACRLHFEEKHARRFELWRRTRWSWLMEKRWPWSRPVVGDEEFNVPS